LAYQITTTTYTWDWCIELGPFGIWPMHQLVPYFVVPTNQYVGGTQVWAVSSSVRYWCVKNKHRDDPATHLLVAVAQCGGIIKLSTRYHFTNNLVPWPDLKPKIDSPFCGTFIQT
jgi:hypothetical protein